MNDTHDELAQTFLNYFKASEDFERSPSERTKRTTRRELRKIITLAKKRQEEVKEKYNVVLDDIRKSQKWQHNSHKKTTQYMSWFYKDKEITTLPDDCEGFVYLITNKINNMKYIGKKLAKFKTTKPPLKGKKNKRRGYKESDWRDYWGSSDRLNEDVKELGEENFTREILYMCPSRGVASYLEAKEQFIRGVLETDEYYNGIINVRVGGSKILKEALRQYKDIV